MESRWNENIRTPIEQQNLYLLQAAPSLQMNAVRWSKIEKDLLQLKRKQTPTISHILKADVDELLTLWLSD